MNKTLLLPKIKMPTFDVEVPFSTLKVKIRPETAREEKILLIAKESGDYSDILGAIKQIVNNCIVSPEIDVNEMALFDLEYIYLRIQAVSVSNIIKLEYRDKEDDVVRQFDVDLDKVQVKHPDEKEVSNGLIDIGDGVSIQMSYPNSSLFNDKEFLNLGGEKMIEELVYRCVRKIHNENNVIDVSKDISSDELKEWLNTISSKAYDEIKKYLRNMPTLYYEINYTNNNKNERKIVLSTLNDFFMLR